MTRAQRITLARYTPRPIRIVFAATTDVTTTRHYDAPVVWITPLHVTSPMTPGNRGCPCA